MNDCFRILKIQNAEFPTETTNSSNWRLLIKAGHDYWKNYQRR